MAGELYAGGECIRCIVTDRVHDLLGGDTGEIPEAVQPLADALTGTRSSWGVRQWIARSSGARLLAKLASEHTKITHEHLDALPQDHTVHHIREMLVTTGLLPRRHEAFAQLELWVKRRLADLPTHQQLVVRPFAEWHVVRDARRRAKRDRYTTGAASADRRDINTAIGFVTWTERQGLELASVTQAHLDRWVDDRPTQRRGLHSFVRWAVARRLTGELVLEPGKTSLPAKLLTEEEHLEQLKRCLNDETIPLAARIAGALTRLYGLSTSRIIAMTTDRFERDGEDAYLTIDRFPVLLPPKLARLIEQQINGRGSFSVFHQAADGKQYLLPGRPASRPIHPVVLRRVMTRHGLPVLAARNTTMIEVTSELPPIVVSDLFGVHPNTAHRWAQYAQDSWADYLAVCLENEE